MEGCVVAYASVILSVFVVQGPQSVCTTFSTFVCTMCAGIHREFEHRVKSISMATFDESEVAALRAGGNEVARQYWRATYRLSEFVVPEPSENRAIREKRVRDFIKMTYIDKRWVKPVAPVKEEKKVRRQAADTTAARM
jgi:hypothetical protein